MSETEIGPAMNHESLDSEFDKHISSVKEDETVLWMLLYISRSRFGTRFVAWLILKILEKRTGTKTIRDKVEECLDQGKYDLRQTADLMEFARTIGKKDDPIWMTKKDMTHNEMDHSKRVLCKFIRTGCVKGTACRFSHHPSMIWKKICSLSETKWYPCDFSRETFGFIFRVSNDFEYEFSVIIFVPRETQVETDKMCMVQIKGDEEDVRNCVISLRKKISILRDGQHRSCQQARDFVESVMKKCHADQEKEKDETPHEVCDSDDTDGSDGSDEPKVLDTVVSRYRMPEIKDPKRPRSDDSLDEPEVSNVVEPIVRKRHRRPYEIRDPRKKSHGSVDDEPNVSEHKRLRKCVGHAKEMHTNDVFFSTLMKLPEAKRSKIMWKIVQEVPFEMLKDATRTRKKWSDDSSA